MSTTLTLTSSDSKQRIDPDLLNKFSAKLSHTPIITGPSKPSELSPSEKQTSSMQQQPKNALQTGGILKIRLHATKNQEEIYKLYFSNPDPEEKNYFVWNKDEKKLSFHGNENIETVTLNAGQTFLVNKLAPQTGNFTELNLTAAKELIKNSGLKLENFESTLLSVSPGKR